MKCTCHRWLCKVHVASSASSFSKLDLPVTGMSWEIPEACAKAVPLMAFTIPGSMLNASLCSSSILFVGGTGHFRHPALLFLDFLQDSLLFFQQSG